MEFVYTDSINKVIKKEIKDARKDGHRVSEVILSASEFQELKEFDEAVQIGGMFHGCLITVTGD